MKRVLITGATGFVGANLARRLLQDGYDVHILYRDNSDLWRIKNVYNDIYSHCVDIVDEEKLKRIIKKIKPEWIFHLAAYGAYSWQRDLGRIIETNIKGTINLVEACIKTGFEAFINTGSSSEYGLKDHAPSEEEALFPNSSYASAKAYATTICSYIARSKKVHLTTLRLYSVYGPYEEPGRLMPTLIIRALAGRLPPLARQSIMRDYVYIDDVCEAYISSAGQAKASGEIYNIGTGRGMTLYDVISAAKKILSVREKPEWGTMPDRSWDTDVWVADSSKALKELGWKPRYKFNQGFRAMVDWFRAEPEMVKYYSRRMK